MINRGGRYEMKLEGKLLINGKIKALTGLHIGGATTDAAIGDIDNCVIKTSEGVPFIPGSSLKGKLRSLLEKKEGLNLCRCGRASCNICVIFGSGADKRTVEAGPTRLLVRDCHLTEETKNKMENNEGEFKELELIYTEIKWENVIDRLTSAAQHPRQMERVPRGAEFDFQMVFNLMEKQDVDRFEYFMRGLSLLEDDYLGGSGSRGYGLFSSRIYR
jgi:CRISPR-associated protein Csm3